MSAPDSSGGGENSGTARAGTHHSTLYRKSPCRITQGGDSGEMEGVFGGMDAVAVVMVVWRCGGGGGASCAVLDVDPSTAVPEP